jgi:hypothetical protein
MVELLALILVWLTLNIAGRLRNSDDLGGLLIWIAAVVMFIGPIVYAFCSGG